jgi:hypothetical protein
MSAPGRYSGFPIRDTHGREHLVLVVKVTFAVDPGGRVELADDGPAPYACDEFWGEDPTKSGIRRPSDLALEKPGTEVLLVGSAHARTPRDTHADVRLTVGPIDKTVRAFGLRVWQRGEGGVVPGAARPMLDPVPLVWELAFGGMDLSDPSDPRSEPRNTIGRGIARDPATLVNQAASQLELPGRSFREPAGFGPIHRHWQPRVAFAGTYDQAWMDEKMPALPDDFDPRYNLSAQHDQWSPAPLRGDEAITVTGATAAGAWRIALPRLAIGFSSRVAGKTRSHRTHLDTILVDADLGRVELTWRASFPTPPKYEQIEKIEIVDKRVVAEAVP